MKAGPVGKTEGLRKVREERRWSQPTKAPVEVTKLSQVIQIDEGRIQMDLGGVVHSTLEDTLNALLDAEADRGCSERIAFLRACFHQGHDGRNAL
jgi:hypothetical protein